MPNAVQSPLVIFPINLQLKAAAAAEQKWGAHVMVMKIDTKLFEANDRRVHH